jgi:hypothetical protein
MNIKELLLRAFCRYRAEPAPNPPSPKPEDFTGDYPGIGERMQQQATELARQQMATFQLDVGNRKAVRWHLPDSWGVVISPHEFISLLLRAQPAEIIFASFYHVLGDSHDYAITLGDNMYFLTSQYNFGEENLPALFPLSERDKQSIISSEWTGPRVKLRRIDWATALNKH